MTKSLCIAAKEHMHQFLWRSEVWNGSARTQLPPPGNMLRPSIGGNEGQPESRQVYLIGVTLFWTTLHREASPMG